MHRPETSGSDAPEPNVPERKAPVSSPSDIIVFGRQTNIRDEHGNLKSVNYVERK